MSTLSATPVRPVQARRQLLGPKAGKLMQKAPKSDAKWYQTRPRRLLFPTFAKPWFFMTVPWFFMVFALPRGSGSDQKSMKIRFRKLSVKRHVFFQKISEKVRFWGPPWGPRWALFRKVAWKLGSFSRTWFQGASRDPQIPKKYDFFVVSGSIFYVFFMVFL